MDSGREEGESRSLKIGKIFLAVVFLSLTGCNSLNQATSKTVLFSDGKTGEVTFEIVAESNNDRILTVEFIQDEAAIRESEVYGKVSEIWDTLKVEAENEKIDEGLIKYGFLSDYDERKKRRVYEILLFEAVRAENGRWTIRRVS